jgi:hypothetical protein
MVMVWAAEEQHQQTVADSRWAPSTPLNGRPCGTQSTMCQKQLLKRASTCFLLPTCLAFAVVVVLSLGEYVCAVT